MNQKVGIVTFHNAHNYGAVLQAYGLHRKLELLGFKSEFIQNQNNSVGKKYRLYPRLSGFSLLQYLKSWVGLILDFKRRKSRYDAFQSFISNKIPTYDLNGGSTNYSSVVLGSDQIWNFDITGGLDDIYFGQNENIITENVFSYAASMGKGMIDKNFTKEYKINLSKLTYIGVREGVLAQTIKDKFNLNCNINVDPTLLLDKNEWDQLASCNENCEDYVLVYEVEKHDNTQKVVDFIKTHMGLKVKIISSKLNRKLDKGIISTASPEKFLTLFKNAKFVVTSSFHGTVFSIINEVPFYTMKFNNGIDHRSSGLLKSLDLNVRHIESDKEIVIEQIRIDYTSANLKLKYLRDESVKYLKSSLRNSKN